MNIVCVINDHPAHLTLMMVHLLRLRLGVVACGSELALEMVTRFVPDLIFVEVQPPGDKELSLIPQLRALLPDGGAAIVVLSANVQSDLAEAVFEAGADAVYQHPKDISQLSTLLAQYLGSVAHPLP